MTNRPRRAGFTLVEMMVVATICLLVVTITVPVFRVSTQTVSSVERKLALYAAARNILDTFESESRLAVMNERGGHFSLKSLAFQDTDPFTPQYANPDTIKYHASRREADCLNMMELQPGGYDYINVVGGKTVPLIPGSQGHPLAYPTNWGRYAEGWRVQLTSTLSYQTPSVVDVDQMEGHSSIDATDQLADVAQITTPVHAYAISNYHKDNVTDGGYASAIRMYDENYDMLGPGKEPRNARRVQTEEYLPGRQHYRGISGIRVMDLDIAYWDATLNAFVNPPDSHAVYFSRPPKALRFTISVCDRDKRVGSLTVQRIVYLPTGSFKGTVANTSDATYYAFTSGGTAPTNPNKGTVFNRTKRLKNLPPMYNGDYLWEWGDASPHVNTRYSEAPVSPVNDLGVFGTYRLWPRPPLPLNW